MHGARKPETIRRDSAHPMYKLGRYSKRTKLAYSMASARLAELESIAFGSGLMQGSRTKGRKPSTHPSVDNRNLRQVPKKSVKVTPKRVR